MRDMLAGVLARAGLKELITEDRLPARQLDNVQHTAGTNDAGPRL
jgi:hypothetical protein